MKPAWSEQFDRETLRQAATLHLDGPITKEWAWGGATGAGIKVGIIDSGVDGDHPAIGGTAGGVIVEYDEETQDVNFVEGPHGDLFGHGTACAGIIRKAAPECEIYSIRVLGRDLTGRGIVFASGLRWAIENRLNVVNLSLSTSKRTFYDLFHELADEAYFHNVMLVSAINNIKAQSYPSEYSSVFSVAAHGGMDPFRFDYNPAPPVEFGAPGIDVEVAWVDNSYTTVTGNSFAAPHIAGLVARILSKHPHLTPFQMKTILHSLADNAAAA